MTTLGFLGLGSMGRAMARRLVDAGHDVVVWNRSPAAVDELVAAGARAARTPEEPLGAPVSFSMLANDDAVRAVLDPGAVAAARGCTHVVMASISPALGAELTTAFADSGVAFVGAPVLGRPDVAAAGKLNILAAGDSADIDAVEPLLSVLSARVWRMGSDPAVSYAVKASVNYNIIHAMQAIGESVAMTERLGVDPSTFVDLLSSTLFSGVVYTGYGRIIADQAYDPPGFHIALGRKDLLLAEQIAATTGVSPATMPALVRVFERALADPQLKDADWSAIAEVSRRDLL